MTKIKLCGLSRICDMEAANELKPDYVGFVFAAKSPRCVTPQIAAELKRRLDPGIAAVGVFVNENINSVVELLNRGTIDIAQLHGVEDEEYINRLRSTSGKPVIKAFRVETQADIIRAQNSTADFVLLDSGNGGTGTVFNWKLIRNIQKPYFLAGGLQADNVGEAVRALRPYGVDVSSGIETDGLKDKRKMKNFICAVRSV